MSHSPGPWRWEVVLGHEDEPARLYDANDDEVIAGGAEGDCGWVHGAVDVLPADAALIADAPALLDALEACWRNADLWSDEAEEHRVFALLSKHGRLK